MEQIIKLYLRWREIMGGDDPRYDNDYDSFMKWLAEEIEMCEEAK